MISSAIASASVLAAWWFRRFFMAVVIALVTAQVAFSADIHVSPGASIAAASRYAKPGDTVLVAPGTYKGGITTSASGVTYRSTVPGGAKIKGGGSDTVWRDSGSNTVIQGFDVDGDGSARMGIYGTGSNSKIIGNTVHHILTDASAFSRAKASGNGGAAIELDSYNGGAGGTIAGNTVYAVGQAGQSTGLVHGIYMIQPGIVSKNNVRDVAGAGITTWHGAKNIIITENTIDRARSIGMYLGCGDSGSGTPGCGDNFTVTANRISNSPEGIAEGGTTGPNNVYAGNVFENIPGPKLRLQTGKEINMATATAPTAEMIGAGAAMPASTVTAATPSTTPGASQGTNGGITSARTRRTASSTSPPSAAQANQPQDQPLPPMPGPRFSQ